ncbi:hypothetical protein AVEN_174020-1 [Araneus ventricosus]|uniref:Mariner Mos1 transposase n=1 Tax=Araneus ventricosus TaxID=182803 RepID=A0A4Y2HED1_ARAVE|nr:hypothetical protein AVEN_174020-1 [Araneus ventricosus]
MRKRLWKENKSVHLMGSEGGVYHGLLKCSKIVHSARYQQYIVNLNHMLIVKRPQGTTRHYKLILLHDNASSHTSKPVNKHVNISCNGGIISLAIFTRLCAARFSLFSGRSPTYCPNSTSAHTTICPDGYLTGFPPKKESSIRTVSTPYLKDEKNM